MAQKGFFELSSHCRKFISQSKPVDYKMKHVLASLAEMVGEDELPDQYGEGAVIQSFEEEIAGILGKESAVFMPSGTMAQQIALRIWSDRRGSKHVAFHPKCHLEIHEQKGYQMLHGLHGILVGDPNRLITLDDLRRLSEPLAALLLELPQREIGGQLPAWEDLVATTQWARIHGTPVHMDGARLWQCAPFYECSYAEISALFDSVYVSFYKDLNGITGSILAGSKDFISEARIWQRRYGGNLIRMYPFVLSAKKGMELYLPRMGEYYQRAVQIAKVLTSFPDVEVVPNPPHTNMMHVYIRGDKERLEQAAYEIAEEHRVMLFYKLGYSSLENYHKTEYTIKDPGLEITDEEICKYYTMLFEKVKAG